MAGWVLFGIGGRHLHGDEVWEQGGIKLYQFAGRISSGKVGVTV